MHFVAAHVVEKTRATQLNKLIRCLLEKLAVAEKLFDGTKKFSAFACVAGVGIGLITIVVVPVIVVAVAITTSIAFIVIVVVSASFGSLLWLIREELGRRAATVERRRVDGDGHGEVGIRVAVVHQRTCFLVRRHLGNAQYRPLSWNDLMAW